MITVAIPIMGAVLWLWLAFCGTVWCSFNCLMALWAGKFIRATIWGCMAAAGFFWWRQENWIPDPYQFDRWLKGSATLVCLVIAVVGVFSLLKYLHKRRQLQAGVPPFGTMPQTEGNVVPFVKATRLERERVMQIQNRRCANPYCNMDLRQSFPHWDHIIPRSQGGTDSVHNMQWLCDTCNLNKKDMTWLEFLFRYAKGMGQDPNQNQAPWKKWVLARTTNGLQCQG